MAFTVKDFEDLLELLRANPEWRRKLWELLASEELLRLPAEVEAFRREFQVFRDQTFEEFRKATEERFQRVEAQIAALVEFQRRHYEEFVAFRQEFLEHRREFEALRQEFIEHRREFLEHRQEFLEHRREFEALRQEFIEHRREFLEHRQEFLEHRREFEALRQEFIEHRQEFLEHRREFEALRQEFIEHRREFIEHRQEFLEHRREFQKHRREFEALRQDVGVLKDNDLKRRYSERAPAYFGRRDFRKVRALPISEVVEALEKALDAGWISPEEFQDARLADVVVQGWWKDQPLYLVLEISWAVDEKDVERAIRRAEIFRKALGETWPGVAGERLTEEAQARIARLQGQGQPIVVAQDGQVDWPA